MQLKQLTVQEVSDLSLKQLIRLLEIPDKGLREVYIDRLVNRSLPARLDLSGSAVQNVVNALGGESELLRDSAEKILGIVAGSEGPHTALVSGLLSVVRSGSIDGRERALRIFQKLRQMPDLAIPVIMGSVAEAFAASQPKWPKLIGAFREVIYRHGPDSIPLLFGSMKGADPKLHAVVIEELGSGGGRVFATALEWLQTPDPLIVGFAIETLFHFETKIYRSQVPALLKVLESGNELNISKVGNLIRRIGGSIAFEPMLQFMKSAGVQGRTHITKMLQKIEIPQQRRLHIIHWVDFHIKEYRQTKGLENYPIALAVESVRLLEKMALTSAEIASTSDTFVSALRHSEPAVNGAAAKAVAAYAPRPTETIADLVNLLISPDRNVAHEAKVALLKFGDTAVENMRRAAKDKGGVVMGKQIAEIFTELATPSSIDGLISFLDDTAKEQKLVAIKSFQQLGQRALRALPRLTDVMEERREERAVRVEAVYALKTFGL